MKNERCNNIGLCGAIVATILSLSACSTVSLSKEQCLTGNWRDIGYNDGVLGRSPSRISEHQQACAETGVIPNFQTWEEGRKKGLVHYCTDANARHLGQKGKTFNTVCPASQVNRLQKMHDTAYRKYKRQKEISRDKSKLEGYRTELSKLRSGDMLDFETEIEAREHMLKIQKEILTLEKRIRKNQRVDGLD